MWRHSNLIRRAFSAVPSTPNARVTLRSLRAQYNRGTPLTMVTAYDYAGGRHVDSSGAEMVLVGDSLGMVVLGHENTQQVTLNQMIYHARAVRNGVKRALVVADLPFGTYENSIDNAVQSTVRMVKEARVDAVKVEGCRPSQVRAIRDIGVPVMGHVGLTPQAVGVMGGFRPFGRIPEEARKVLDDAVVLQDAGCFAIVMECVPAPIAKAVTDAVNIPTIGIGSGVHCDGQVLVYHDALGMGEYSPRFAKRYAEVGKTIRSALEQYKNEVRERQFPASEHDVYGIDNNHDWNAFSRACSLQSTGKSSS